MSIVAPSGITGLKWPKQIPSPVVMDHKLLVSLLALRLLRSVARSVNLLRIIADMYAA
jgi:hypothetical protein